MSAELAPRLTLDSVRDLAVVVGGANPHIPHETGEKDHHGSSTQRSTKLELSRIINLGVLARSPAINHMRIVGSALALLQDNLGRGSIVGCGMAVGGMAVGHVSIGVAIAIAIGMTIGLAVGSSVNSSHVVGVCLFVQLLLESGCSSTCRLGKGLGSRVGFNV